MYVFGKGGMRFILVCVCLVVLDRFLVGGYLSSEALVNMLSKTVMETMNWPSISSHLDCLVRPVLGGPELSLEIRWVCVCVCVGVCPQPTGSIKSF